MLTPTQRDICFKTISSSSLFYLALDALERKLPFSIVRMADGEKHLYDLILENLTSGGDQLLLPGVPGAKGWLTEGWLRRMGLYGIPLSELRRRMDYAARRTTFFAPSHSAFDDPEYDIFDYFPEPAHYGECFFNVIWHDDFKTRLFKQAGHVLCIHGNPNTADSMQLRVQANLGVKTSWIQLTSWEQTHDVITKANTCTAPLVLFSGGPSSKMIGPMVAEAGNKVVLDIGNQMDRWTFSHLPLDREKANAFHREWSAKNTQWEEQLT